MTDKTKILALLILYKRELNDSETWNTLLNNTPKNVTILIFNNGPKSVTPPKSFSGKIIEELSNVGISKAIKKTIDYAKIINATHLITLDQDTIFPNNFWSKLEDGLSNFKDADTLLPLVISNKQLISPAIWKYGRAWPNSKQKSENYFNLSKQTFINSGALYPISVIKKIWDNSFDNLFIDNIDHLISRRMSEYNMKAHIIDVEINQHFSNYSASKENVYNRFRLWKKDQLEFGKLTGTRLLQIFWIIRRRVGLFIRYLN